MFDIAHDLQFPPELRADLSQLQTHKASIMRTRITVSPGVDLDVIQSGNPVGPPLLLLHGLSDSNASMRILMDELPPGIRAIAITQRGHGDSAKPEGPYTTDVFVADVLAAMDALGVRRAVVYGHSMGSIVAQRLAARHPERVAGLVLEGAFPGLKSNPDVHAFYNESIAGLTDPIDPAFAREFQVSTIARPVSPAFLDMITAESCKLPARAWKQILQDMMAFDTDEEVARVQAPTLLLWGDQDGFVRRVDQDRLLAAIKGATLVVFEGTGHDPHWEEPRRVADLIAAFVARHLAPASAGGRPS